jgi:hypothetical protein
MDLGWLKQQTVDGYVEYLYVVAYLDPDSYRFGKNGMRIRVKKAGSGSASKSFGWSVDLWS